MTEPAAAAGTAGSAAPGRTLRSVLGTALVAVAAFAAAAAVVGAAVPEGTADPPDRRAQIAAWRADPVPADLMVFGSSTLYRGLVPEVIDARLAERGHRVRTWNLAFRASASFETDACLRRVLAGPGPRPRWAVIEFPEWRTESRNLDTLRSLAWHDAAATRNALDGLAADRRRGARPGLALEHVRLFLGRASGLGQGPGAVEAAFGADPARTPAAAEYARTRGHRPVEGDPDADDPEGRRADFLADLDGYAARVAALRRAGGAAADDGSYPVGPLRRQVEAVVAAGVEPVHVVAPVVLAPAAAGRMAREGVVRTLLRFDDPARYPELYDAARRFDAAHVDAGGAVFFSRAFADAFAERLEAERR